MFQVPPKLLGENNKDYSYRVIKEAIMTLQLLPGQSISELDLAQALQISRTPIREVFTKLREEHLLEVVPQVGTKISKINPMLVEEAIFIRTVLEKEILKLSCESFPEDQIRALKENIAHQELLLGQSEKEKEFHKLDKEFHYLIYQANNKENVWDAINRLSTHYNRVRLLSEIKYSFKEAIIEHKMIVNIIENKEKDKVDQLVNRHIVEPIKLWEDLYKPDSPYVDYFDLTFKMPVI